TLVVQIEIAEIKKGFVGWRCSARAGFYGSLLPSNARRGGGRRSPRYGHLSRLRDGADRAGICCAGSSAKRRLHPTGGTFLRRARRDRQECGEESVAGDDCGRGSCATTETGAHGFAGGRRSRCAAAALSGVAQGGRRQSAATRKSGRVGQCARSRISKGKKRSKPVARRS